MSATGNTKLVPGLSQLLNYVFDLEHMATGDPVRFADEGERHCELIENACTDRILPRIRKLRRESVRNARKSAERRAIEQIFGRRKEASA